VDIAAGKPPQQP